MAQVRPFALSESGLVVMSSGGGAQDRPDLVRDARRGPGRRLLERVAKYHRGLMDKVAGSACQLIETRRVELLRAEALGQPRKHCELDLLKKARPRPTSRCPTHLSSCC